MSPDVSGKFASGCAEFDKVANSRRTLGWDVVVGWDGEVIFQWCCSKEKFKHIVVCTFVTLASLMGLINTQEPQCSNKKMEIEAGWDRAEQERWTGDGGEGVADRCGQFFSDSFKKRDSSIVVCTFLISRTVSQDPFQVKKRCLIQSRAGKVDIGWGRGWRIDLATGPGWTRPGAVDLSLVWGIKICQLQHHFQRLCSLKQQR